jgi:hypothetical protein
MQLPIKTPSRVTHTLDNTKTELIEIWLEGIDWIFPAQDRIKW